MPRYKFDFLLNIWMQDVEIEADNYEEAEELLYEMTSSDILREGYEKQSDITDLDVEEIEEDNYFEED